jgi:hypothetical protein
LLIKKTADLTACRMMKFLAPLKVQENPLIALYGNKKESS